MQIFLFTFCSILSFATYTVKKGDTLITIARKFNTTYMDIARKNNIKNANKIYIGQILKI